MQAVVIIITLISGKKNSSINFCQYQREIYLLRIFLVVQNFDKALKDLFYHKLFMMISSTKILHLKKVKKN